MSFADQLTVARIAATPFVLALLVWSFPNHYYYATVLFGLAMITDWFDGRVARSSGRSSALGTLLDPIADKVLVLSTMIALVEYGIFPGWLVALIVAREFLVSGLRLAAIERGVRQLVVLGAGLDTYAYRSPWRDRLRVFEVDHPSTQAWKLERLAEAAIPVPAWLTFAPVDFERETLAEGLQAAGFDAAQQTFFTWLGVVPYLTEEAVWATAGFIASLPHGAHVVFDYGEDPALLSPEVRDSHEKRAAHVAAMGEAFVSRFTPDGLRAKLTGLGFSEIEDLGPRQIASRYFPSRASSAPERGGHILRASTVAGSTTGGEDLPAA